MINRKSATISVVIPTYNRKGYVERCVQSVIDQSYKNVEIIVCDNASSDGSPKILRNLLEKSGRPFKLVEHVENIGPYRNWVSGVEIAKGEAIKVLFSDDFLEPDCLEIQSRELFEEHSDCGFVISGALEIDEETGADLEVYCGEPTRIGLEEFAMGMGLRVPHLPYTLSTALIRKGVLIDNVNAVADMSSNAVERAIGPDVIMLYGGVSRSIDGYRGGSCLVKMAPAKDSITLNSRSLILKDCYEEAFELILKQASPYWLRRFQMARLMRFLIDPKRQRSVLPWKRVKKYCKLRTIREMGFVLRSILRMHRLS